MKTLPFLGPTPQQKCPHVLGGRTASQACSWADQQQDKWNGHNLLRLVKFWLRGLGKGSVFAEAQGYPIHKENPVLSAGK